MHRRLLYVQSSNGRQHFTHDTQGLIPLGTPDASVSKQIAEVQRLVRGHPEVKAGNVNWSMHSAGTTLEGSWQTVTSIIGQAHQLLHDQGVVRIQTDIRIGSRTDKKQTMKDKVDVVERLLAADGRGGGGSSTAAAEEPSTVSTLRPEMAALGAID